MEAMKKLVNQLKNSTIASNDIPQGLNEGNVDEHIIINTTNNTILI